MSTIQSPTSIDGGNEANDHLEGKIMVPKASTLLSLPSNLAADSNTIVTNFLASRKESAGDDPPSQQQRLLDDSEN